MPSTDAGEMKDEYDQWMVFPGIYIDNEYNLPSDVVDGLQKWLPEIKD
jgi:hypothetical protein